MASAFSLSLEKSQWEYLLKGLLCACSIVVFYYLIKRVYHAHEWSLADRAFTSGKLPSTVWAELQADIARGARERGVQLRVCHTYHLNPPNTILDKYKKAIGKMKKPNEQQLYHGTRSFDAVLSIADFLLHTHTFIDDLRRRPDKAACSL